MSTDFDVACRRHGPVVEIVPHGEMETTTAETVVRAMERALDPGTQLVIMDLGGVTFIDTTGLTALIDCKGRADGLGVSLEIRDVQPFQRRVLEITGLDAILDIGPCAGPGDTVDPRRRSAVE